MNAFRAVLGMFAKTPQLGKVKTRLAASIGDPIALRIYSAMLDCSLRRFASEPWTARILSYSPPHGSNWFEKYSDLPWRLRDQGAGDLGERMSRFFQEATEQFSVPVCLVGSDSPDLPLSRLASAVASLEQSEVVLVPSEDGGYCLIGMSRYRPEVFQNIDWSTSEVLRQTTARMQAAGIRFELLEPWYDLDERSDLTRFLDASAADPEVAQLQLRVREILAQS